MVLVKADRIAFDWERGRFNPSSRVTIAEVVMPALPPDSEPRSSSDPVTGTLSPAPKSSAAAGAGSVPSA
jgi:hypothetical protein